MRGGDISKAVLITGCSTGIGRATAQRLSGRGWRVYATARRPESIEDLAASGCRLLQIDVCDELSMKRAVDVVETEEGAVGVLINNAGYGLERPVEELTAEEIRRQFETNLFGPMHLTQLVLPGMRRQGWGKVLNVGSVGGQITIPGGGAYHASKHALEALSDALRFEVRGFGVDVILIEPGAIRTNWVDTAVAGMNTRDRSGPYGEFEVAVANRLRSAHEGLLARFATDSESVAEVMERAINTRRPRARYTVPAVAATFTFSRRFIPDRMWDAFMRRLLPSPGVSDSVQPPPVV